MAEHPDPPLLQPGAAHRLPAWAILAMVAVGTVVFGSVNVHNAHAMAPNWGQDLAFFTQLVHSAANGGPWASPLLLEPQGFWEMVHTHLVLPLVVAAYAIVPRQETLLALQAGFVSLAFWPAARLGEAVGGRRLGLLAVAGLALFGPFQALATADFHPVVLFVPGILGVFASAWEGRTAAMLGWAAVALAGRQEASYLLGAAGLALVVVPWGPAGGWRHGRRWRQGAALLVVAVVTFAAWVVVKPQIFFHFDPFHPAAPPVIDAENRAGRLAYGLGMSRSGMLLGLLQPAGLVAVLPVVYEMLRNSGEWYRLTGPSAHHAAFWLPFLLASAIAGAGRLGRWGAPLMLVLNATAFPWVRLREGPVELASLARSVPPGARVAADYDTIHTLAGRRVLWNVDELYLPDRERPLGWRGHWPLTLDDVDVLVLPADSELAARAQSWRVVAAAGDHVVLERPRFTGF